MWEDREVLIYSNYEPESSGTKNRRNVKEDTFSKKKNHFLGYLY